MDQKRSENALKRHKIKELSSNAKKINYTSVMKNYADFASQNSRPSILYENLRQKYSREDIKAAITIPEILIPISIFSQGLSPLEALIKYMKENLGMRFRDISLQINRDERSIWYSYSRVKESKRLRTDEHDIKIPLSALADRKLSILENIISFLKHSHDDRQIATILGKSKSTIWSAAKRAEKKSAGKKPIKVSDIHEDTDLIELRKHIRSEEQLFLLETPSIPLTVFTGSLPPLGALVKYMKENLGIRLSEISKRLNRDQRTIGNAYSKAHRKHPLWLSPKKSRIIIPITIFSDRKFSLLESIVRELSSQDLTVSGIAARLNLSKKTVYTIKSRIRSKDDRK